jgi:ABC-type glycerol-3-phosphate transport system substrate-binding protein
VEPRSVHRLLALICAFGTLTPGCERRGAVDDFAVITVWAHQGQERENAAMRGIVAAFNDLHRDEKLRVEITFFPDRQYADKVSMASASGTLPDVVDIDGPHVGPWAAEGLLQPLDEVADQELLADMLPSLIEQGTYNGKLYALGAFESALVVYYNRDVIDKAGLHPPQRVEDTWSWDQFIGALQKVKPHVKLPLSLHMDDASHEWFTYAFSPLIWSNGGRLIAENGKDVKGVLNGPRTIDAVRKWQALFTAGLAEPTSTNPDPFSAGLAAFDWTGHWMLPTFERTEGLRFGAMPLPRMGDKPVCASGSWCWGMSRACKDRSAAWKVIRFFLDPERGVKPMIKANGAVPGRRSAFQYFPEYDEMPRRLFREQLDVAAHPRPRTPVYLSLTDAFAKALRDIALGADVEEALTAAAEAVQRAADRRAASNG